MRSLLSFVFLLIFTVLFVIPQHAFATENFETDYAVVYSVGENGVTHADLKITMTNTTEDYYAASYAIAVGFENIANVVASDEGGRIRPTISKTDDGQKIELNFNKKTVGKGSKARFTVSFDTPEIAQRFGKIWEINIPGISSKNDFNSFTVEVKVPPSFGKPAYIKPAQSDNSLVFRKNQLEDSGISIAFGEKQLYTFRLTYHLKNNNVFPVKTEIALPPSTNYQEVFIQSIDPKPSNVIVDTDGNWLAQYNLLPSQKTDVHVRGKAELYLYPKEEELSSSQLKAYTKPVENWTIEAGTKGEQLHDVKTPKDIYDFVVKSLTYDFSRVTANEARLGAQQVLINPTSAVCREFTDLFIAVARMKGIAAREVNGFAYTENSKQRPLSLVRDILHAWPEYYDTDKKTWVMVDPTWGNTTNGVDYFHTLDFDHFTFVRKGMESEYPIPAGGYKYPGDEGKKDVEVTFADSTPAATNDIGVRLLTQPEYIAGFPVEAVIKVTNTGETITSPQTVNVLAKYLTPVKDTFAVAAIPPFGYREVPVELARTPVLTNKRDTLTITISGRSFNQQIAIIPLYLTKWAALAGGICGILAIIIFVITRRTRRIPVS
jgi:hypothetical protein